MLLTSGAYHIHLYRKFTPVYSVVECGGEAADLEKFTVGREEIELGMIIEVTCSNPNPYSVEVFSSEPGGIYIGHGPTSLEAGKLTVDSRGIGAHATGVVSAKVRILVEGADAEELLPHFLQDDDIPITLRLQFAVGVQTRFGPSSWGAEAILKKDCGLNVRGLLAGASDFAPLAQSRIGPLVCGDRWFGLGIPDVADPEAATRAAQQEEHEGPMEAQMPLADFSRGEIIKDATFGLLVVLSVCSGVLVPALAWSAGWLAAGPSAERGHEAVDQEQSDALVDRMPGTQESDLGCAEQGRDASDAAESIKELVAVE